MRAAVWSRPVAVVRPAVACSGLVGATPAGRVRPWCSILRGVFRLRGVVGLRASMGAWPHPHSGRGGSAQPLCALPSGRPPSPGRAQPLRARPYPAAPAATTPSGYRESARPPPPPRSLVIFPLHVKNV